MNYGIFGVMMPLLMEKPTMEYLEDAGISVSAREIKREFRIPECRITYTKCAICEMAKRENCFHLVRYMCTTDYASQELMGNTLIRTKTLGNGDECCDFHIIGRKSKEKKYR